MKRDTQKEYIKRIGKAAFMALLQAAATFCLALALLAFLSDRPLSLSISPNAGPEAAIVVGAILLALLWSAFLSIELECSDEEEPGNSKKHNKQ